METERLLLRKLEPTDTKAIFDMRSDADVMKYIGKPAYSHIDEAAEFVNTNMALLEKNEGINWAISTRERPRDLIGVIGFWRILKTHFRAEVGYTLQKEHWRKGIVKEALLQVLSFGFNGMNLHSVEAHIHPENIASAKLLESCGFIREAYFKEDFFFNGKFEDTAIYSKLNC